MPSTTTTPPKAGDKMYGLVIEEFKKPYKYREDLTVPQVGPKEVLIEIRTAGYCHTEAMVQNGEFAHMMQDDLPLVPSHEPTGVIAAIGEEAAAKSADEPGAAGKGPLKVGERVSALTFKDFCGECEDCKNKQYKFCDKQRMTGVTYHGAFAQYMCADYRSVVRLPDGLSYDAAAPLACAGSTVYTAIKACSLKSGQRVAISGAGALGHLGVQIAKSMGLEVVLLDARDAPLEMCRKLKLAPDVTFNSGKVDVKDEKAVQEAIKQCGGHCDAVIVTTDVIPAFTFGLELTKKHGVFVVVGQPADPIPIPYFPLIFRDITVKGSLLGNPSDFRELCELVVEKGIEVKTRSYGLKEVPQLIEDYHKDTHAGKLVVRVSED